MDRKNPALWEWGFVVAIFLASFCIGYLFKLFSVDIDALIRDAQENIPKLALVLGVMVFLYGDHADLLYI